MSAKWLPPDDLAPAKPEGPRALELASHLIRFDPSDFGSPETDHGGATCYEALREEARLNVLVFPFKPIAQFAVPVQPRAAWGLELNLGIVQREKLVHTVPRIEELDPSTRDPHVFLRHHPRSISRKLFCFPCKAILFTRCVGYDNEPFEEPGVQGNGWHWATDSALIANRLAWC